MKRRFSALLTTALLLTIAVPNAFATPSIELTKHNIQAEEMNCSYYLAPNGSDNNSGSVSSPWATIAYASSQLQPGETLCARGGTYYGQGGYIWNSTSGTPSAPITFAAYPGETPIFDGNWSQGEFLVLNGVQWIVVDGLTVRHYDDEWGNGAILISGSTKHITVEDMHMYDNGTHYNQDHHIYIGAGEVEDVTVAGCLFENPASGNIHTWHGPSVNGLRILNNIIRGGHWGIILNDGAQNIEIYNNTIYDTDVGLDFSLAGEDTSWGVADVSIKNNIIRSTSGQLGMSVGSFNTGDINSDYNLWYGVSNPILWSGASYNVSQYRNATGNADHSFQDAPDFISPAENLHLQTDSPAVDAGDSLGEIQYDFDDAIRPAGDGYDIGAYEYEGTTIPPKDPIHDFSWEAEEGSISDPFVANNGHVAQPVSTDEDPTSGGRAAYRFSISETKDYIVKAFVNASSEGSNSFFINIDSEPINPSMIWDIEVTDGFQKRTVSWRGNGTYNANQFVPKTFRLSAGEHTLIIRGREADTLIDQISLVSTDSLQATLYLPLVISKN